MAKRRSSTRLPRRPPPPATPLNADRRSIFPPPSSVTHGPVIALDRVLRTVRATDAMDYVEEWNGAHWVPSAVPMHLVLQSHVATADELLALGMLDPSANAPDLAQSSTEADDRASAPRD